MEIAVEDSMQKRIALLPIIWGLYGLGEVTIVNYLLGPILNSLPTIPNDKPIGGSYFPVLFFNIAALLAMIGFSFWALGVWTIDLANPKARRDIAALGVMFASGFLVFYYAIFVFPLAVSLVYFLATNIE